MARKKSPAPTLIDDPTEITDAERTETAELPIAVTEPEKVESMPVKYGIQDEAIALMKKQYITLNCDDAAGYEMVRQAIATTRTLRSDIEKKRVELKADALAWGRKVDSEAKRLTGMLLEIEDPLKAKKQAVDDEKDRIRREKEEKERLEKEAALRAEREAQLAKEKTEREAEEKRLADIAAKLEAERKEHEARVAAENKARAEEREREDAKRREEQARIDEANRIERERMAAEQAKIAEQQRIEREKLEAERRAVQEEKDRLQRIEFERQAKERAESEAREKVEREKREAAEQARLAEEERKRVEAERPDVEKVHALGRMIDELPVPELSSVRARNFVQTKLAQLHVIATDCMNYLSKNQKE